MKQQSLRQRLAWALGVTGVVTALLLGGMVWFSEEAIEDAALRQMMRSELELLGGVRAQEHSQQLFFRPARGRPPPEEWRVLPPGTYKKVNFRGHPYQVMVAEPFAGDRLYLAQSLRIGEQRETWLLLALVIGIGISSVLSLAVSGYLSRLALSPLQTLLERVRTLKPGQRGQRLQAEPQNPELDVLIHALNEYMQALDRLVAHERAFAGAAAHELHTPLTVIDGAAELLEARLPAEPALARIRRASTEASQTLDLLLSLSDTREPPPAIRLVLSDELPRLARQCPVREGVVLRWKLTDAIALQAPAAALSLVFLNLLRNALRAAKTEVTVSLDDGYFSISDDGEGIAADLLPQVFEPGVRGSGGGSGLGLHIARVVAERQGWQLGLGNGTQVGAVAELRWSGRSA